jgi:hypothetical protein
VSATWVTRTEKELRILGQRYGEDFSGVDPSKVVSKILSASEFPALLLPPERRAWFVAVLEAARHRACSRAGFEDDPSFWLNWWAATVPHMLQKGVVSYIVDLINVARDPDGKDIMRGHAQSAKDELGLYATDYIREILRDAMQAANSDNWTRYPNWFIRIDAAADRWSNVRALAARWLPAFTPHNVVDLALLRDADPNVRRYTAMNAALYQPKAVNQLAVQELMEALRDRGWIWSSDDYFNYGWAGRHSAAEVLLKLDASRAAALPEIRALVQEEEQKRDALTLSHQVESVFARVERLERALSAS